MNAAIKDFSQIIEIDGKRVSAYTNRGSAFASLGRLDAALADLSKAISLDPQAIDAYTNRARIHMMRREWAGAIKDCEAALRVTLHNDVLSRIRAEAQMKMR